MMLFLILYLSFSLLTFRDYGNSADEHDWYFLYANQYIKHYAHLSSIADDYQNNFSAEQASYCYFWPAILRVFCGESAETYHLMNFLLAIPVFWALYSMLLFAYRKPWLALL